MDEDEIYKPKFDKDGKLVRTEEEYIFVRDMSINLKFDETSIEKYPLPEKFLNVLEFLPKSLEFSAFCLHKSALKSKMLNHSINYSENCVCHFLKALIQIIYENISNLSSIFSGTCICVFPFS